MRFLDRYGMNPLGESTILSRSVADVLTPETRTLERRAFVPPTEAHPISRFFTQEARYNAAGIIYKRSLAHDLAHVQTTSFSSHRTMRPPNPDYFFAARLPYPVGIVDHAGAGMTWAWTPLAYLLYHDRINRKRSRYWQIMFTSDMSLHRDVWARLLQQGVWFHDVEGAQMCALMRALISTDPPADLLPVLMFGDEFDQAMEATLQEAVLDFQHRWNCGEWWHERDDASTRAALNILLDVQNDINGYDDDDGYDE